MITEDYVSFEVAKLLKEKGFDEPTFTYYNNDGYLMNSCNFCGSYTLGCFNNVKDEKVNCAAPTLQMALKWLREVHNIFIQIDYVVLTKDFFEYTYEIYDMCKGRVLECSHFRDNYETYEEAVEEAIKYCLNNLI